MYQDQMFMSFTKEEQMMAVPRWGVRLVKEESFQYPEVSVKCPDDVHEIFRPYFEGLDREHFAVLSLDRKGNVVALHTVSIGGLHSSLVHPRETFKIPLMLSAASIILAHNHPTGDPTPSQEDVEITRRLMQAGEILGISVLDHIVCGDDRYCSLKTKDLM